MGAHVPIGLPVPIAPDVPIVPRILTGEGAILAAVHRAVTGVYPANNLRG